MFKKIKQKLKSAYEYVVEKVKSLFGIETKAEKAEKADKLALEEKFKEVSKLTDEWKEKTSIENLNVMTKTQLEELAKEKPEIPKILTVGQASKVTNHLAVFVENKYACIMLKIQCRECGEEPVAKNVTE
jgi:hypothetical protein